MNELLTIGNLGLGNDFLRRSLCLQQNSLGVGLIEPNTVTRMLSTKLRTGNKTLQGSVVKATAAQEDLSFLDSGLLKTG